MMSDRSPCERCESRNDESCRLERKWIDCSAKDAYEKRMKRERLGLKEVGTLG